MKKISIVHCLIFLLLGSMLLSCSRSASEAEPAEALQENAISLTADQFKNAGIENGSVQLRAIASTLKVNGRIDVPPQNIVSVSVPLGGYLKQTKLLPGMQVRKGEVIATMEDQQYIQLQQDYLTAKARLAFTTNEYERQKALNQSKASSDKVYQQAEADFVTEKITAKALSEKLKLIGINPDELTEATLSKSIHLYSPINGYVSAVNVNIGKYTQPSEVLFELINPSDIHLALTIFEKDLSKISIGQKVIAYSNSQPEKKYACEIILIGMNLSDDRSTEVHSHFEKYDKSLVPGMYMNADVELKNETAYALPEDAVVRYDNKHFVFQQDSVMQYSMIEITPGNSENGFIEVMGGEQWRDKKFAIKGAYSLLMMLKNKAEED